SQGSQSLKDWEYNAKSMLAGINDGQAKSVESFISATKKHFNITDKTPVIGLSHSLAHNNNLTAHLSSNTFNEIYSVNGAQTNYYQLFRRDTKFRDAIINHFSLVSNSFTAIYDLDPNELHDFAQEYYKDKIPVVNQRIST